MQVADETTPAVTEQAETKTNELLRRVTITIESETIEKAIKAELIKASKTVRVDGFRKGKVPLSVVEQRYGASILQDTLGKLMYTAFYDYMVKENINPAGDPNYFPKQFTRNEAFSYDVEFEVFPEVEIKGLDSISIEKPKAEVLESDVDNMLETLRKQQANWKQVEKAATTEDRVEIDFVGSVDGEEFEGGKAENFSLLMGQGRMIPGFEDGIVGHKAGDKFTVDVTFPEDYQVETLKGKAAKFEITLNKVEERDLPELTASFIKRFGVKEGTVEALRDEVRKNMNRELKAVIKNKVKTQLLDGLVAANEFAIPTSLVEREIRTLKMQAIQRFGGKPQDADNLPREIFLSQAERRVRVGLLLGEVIKSSELQVDNNLVDTMIEEMSSAYENPQEVVKHYKKTPDLLNNVRNLALEEQAIEALISKVSVKEVDSSFSELLNQNQNMGL